MNFKIHYFKKDLKLRYKIIISIIQFFEYIIVIPFLLFSIILETIFSTIMNLAKIRFIYKYLAPIRSHAGFLNGRFINKLLDKGFKINK